MVARITTATSMGLRDQVRRPLILALLVVIPMIFISWGARVTAEEPRAITLHGGIPVFTDMRVLMTVIDIPVAIAFFSGLVGVFVVGAALEADRRLVVAGFSPGEAVVPRVLVLGAAVLVITIVALAVGAMWFTPERWGAFIAGNVFTGLEYAAIGALAGALMGRLGAVYFIFFLPNLDIGIAQDPLFFDGDPQGWAQALPGYGPTRTIVESSFSSTTDLLVPVLVSLAWVAALSVALVVVLRHAVAPRA